MDETALELAHSFVIPSYVDAGVESLHHSNRIIRSILAQRRLPAHGLSDSVIEQLLFQLTNMDSNNFAQHIGAGEREGRVLSTLVKKRHYYFSHGIGRSGDVTSDQPKAAGSSLMASLTNYLVVDALRESGVTETQAAVVIPMATGMTLSLVLRTVAKLREIEERKREEKEEAAINSVSLDHDKQESTLQQCETAFTTKSSSNKVFSFKNVFPLPLHTTKVTAAVTARYVIWPRVDQKTALKCIDAAGFTPFPVEPRPALLRQKSQLLKSSFRQEGCSVNHTSKTRDKETESERLFKSTEEGVKEVHPYYVQVHIADIEQAIVELGGRSSVLCVLSTTSCFAPRLPDDVIAISKLCKTYNIAHVINNAYGVQSASIMRAIHSAMHCGRVDFFVQSGDKNFLVPVGGAVIASGDKQKVHSASAMYAGRASGSPSLDIFITLLHLGKDGLRELWKDRYARLFDLVQLLDSFASARHEVLIREDMSSNVLASFFPERELSLSEQEEQQQQEYFLPVSELKEMSKYAKQINNVVTRKSESTIMQNNEDKEKEKTQERQQRRRRVALSELPRNDISLAITMRHYCESVRYHKEQRKKSVHCNNAEDNNNNYNNNNDENKEEWEDDDCNNMNKSENVKLARSLGAKLFRCGVTGPKVVTPNTSVFTTIAGCSFASYGMHTSFPTCAMLIVACGIGVTSNEIYGLVQRLNELWPLPPPFPLQIRQSPF